MGNLKKLEKAKSKKLKLCLEMWGEAGERPYELLIENGLLKFFTLTLLNKRFPINKTLYRGTRRHREKKVGDFINYPYPSSWTLKEEIAKLFKVESEINKFVILRLVPLESICGIYNEHNPHKEEEVVVAPTQLLIVDKYYFNVNSFESIAVFDVVPLKQSIFET